MVDAGQREEREKAWWDAWWRADFSWAGLAQKPVGQNGDLIHGSLHGEKTLQDYWRRDPTTGAVRDDAAMQAAGELAECGGVIFHIAHLPEKDRSGASTWKADLRSVDWEKLDALIAARIGAGSGTQSKFGLFANAEGPDGRAQLGGAVLRGAAIQQNAGQLHLVCEGSAFLGAADFRDFTFGPGASFKSAAFAATARFDRTSFTSTTCFNKATFFDAAGFNSATFADTAHFGEANFLAEANFTAASFDIAWFSRATFGRNVFFRSAAFRGWANLDRATFSKIAVFEHAAFSSVADFTESSIAVGAFKAAKFGGTAMFPQCLFVESVRFDDSSFAGEMNFTAAIFQRLASFDRITWPDAAAHWHSAFDQALFLATLTLTGAGLRAFAAFDGATFERGVHIDDAAESVAIARFRKERAAAIAAARSDNESWANVEVRRKGVDQPPPVSRREIAAHAKEARDMRLRQLERGCRVLKQAMDYASNKPREQLFYRFELMARRAQRNLPFAEKSFSYLYAFASDYGASIWRPFAAMTLLIFAFGAAFLGSAWVLGGVGDNADQIAPAVAAWQALDLSWANTFRPLSALTSDGIHNDTIAGQLFVTASAATQFAMRAVATLQSLLVLVLAFLFALAVRRRFQIN